jgi:hypothetical protein
MSKLGKRFSGLAVFFPPGRGDIPASESVLQIQTAADPFAYARMALEAQVEGEGDGGRGLDREAQFADARIPAQGRRGKGEAAGRRMGRAVKGMFGTINVSTGFIDSYS